MAAAESHQSVTSQPMKQPVAGTNAQRNPSFMRQLGEQLIRKNVQDGIGLLGLQELHLFGLKQDAYFVEVQKRIYPRAGFGYGLGVGAANQYHAAARKQLLQTTTNRQGKHYVANSIGTAYEEGFHAAAWLADVTEQATWYVMETGGFGFSAWRISGIHPKPK
jgi:hypothetical protein